ncbi:glycosyltransferase [Streptomyces sp. NBC_01643]|nr:glycosyltransferase [Streptomyces sp. NBC_01643]
MLQSIAGQTIGFGNIEVVAVDDDSTDGSGALLDE